MKRRSLRALLALSLLFLASCGHRQTDKTAGIEPPQTEAAEQTEQTEQTEPTEALEQTEQTEPGPAAVPDYSTAEALRRSEHVWLYYYPDSVRDEDGAEEMSTDEEEKLKAESTLFIGDGYSIYIVDEEWVYQSGTMGGRHADIWTNKLDGEEAELRIVKMDSSDLGEAQAWVRQQYPNYELILDNKGGLGGSDFPFPNGTLIFGSNFNLLGDSRYAVIYTQPAKTKHYERFRYQMEAMKQSLRSFFYYPTAGELGRPEHTRLSCGAGVESEASLYVGYSYSIYLPDEGWTRKTDIAECKTVGAWRSTVHEGAELRIDRRDHWYPEDEYLTKLLDPEYTLIGRGEHGEVIGESVDGWRMEISDHFEKSTVAEYGTYYVMYKVYPAADPEESGKTKALLDTVTDTFEPFENAVEYEDWWW